MDIRGLRQKGPGTNIKMFNLLNLMVLTLNVKRIQFLLFLGTNRVEVAKKARDIKFMHRMQNKNYMKLGTKANRLQTHFLDRNGMCM